MAGYSGTPLVKKLGIKPGSNIVLVNAPSDYATELDLPPDVTVNSRSGKPLDFAQLFVMSEKELQREFSEYAKRLNASGMLWVSWPKKSSGVSTNLSDNIVRDIGLAAGLVDVKVCAVNEVWSGLKFVVRHKERQKVTQRKRMARTPNQLK
jgi:ABC-type Na+ transport system ATPase subunit NatA